MLATADQVGSKMICPDCGTATVVPPMPRPRPKIDVMAGAEQGAYAIVGDDEPTRPGRAAAPPPRRVREEPPPQRREAADEPEEPEIKLPSRRPVLPDRPFLDGTFTFPFHRCVWVRTIILAIWSIVPGVAVTVVSRRSRGWRRGGAVPRSRCAAFGGRLRACGAMWFAILSATVMAVLRETAEGCDEIENWPGQVFLDWLGEPVHVFLRAMHERGSGRGGGVVADEVEWHFRRR